MLLENIELVQTAENIAEEKGIEKDLIHKMKSTSNGLNQFSIEVMNYGCKKNFFQSKK